MKKFFRFLSIAAAFLAVFASSGLPAAARDVLPAAAGQECPSLPRNLSAGMSGQDVRSLQRFLNGRNFIVATVGAGSPGRESALFGGRTRTALAAFQKANGVFPASGRLGALTRAKIAILCAEAGFAETVQSVLPSGPAPASKGFGSGDGVSFTPTVTAPAAPAINPLPAPATAVPASQISPQSVVAVLCTYRWGDKVQFMKGSGVIVNPAGYVLTARHIVDPRWTYEAYQNTLDATQKDMYANAVLQHCEIGAPAAGTVLPAGSQILQNDPGTLITGHFQYQAETYFVPGRAGLSDNEYKTADFALMRITGTAPDCALWNRDCGAPGSLPYTAASQALPQPGRDEVLSYGYPSEPGVNDASGNFLDFYLKGAQGTVGGYMQGDQRFAGQVLNFSFEAQDIQNGRSGSPIFANGRVIGILYGSTSHQESYNLGIPAILAMLKDSGLDGLVAR